MWAEQIKIMFQFKADDNLIISKMRDYVKSFIIIAKMLKFGDEYKDFYIGTIENNLLSMLKLIY